MKTKSKDKTGYIDRSGAMQVGQQFRRASDFQEGLALVERTREIGYIDETGNFLWTGPYVDVSFAYE